MGWWKWLGSTDVDRASERFCSVTVSDCRFVSQYHSFVTMLVTVTNFKVVQLCPTHGPYECGPVDQYCQPWGFPANLTCFFVDLRFFLKTWALLVFGLVLIEICLFFGLAFCRFLFLRLLFNQILWHFRCFNLLLKADWACFCENLFILGLLFRICLLAFLFNFLADLSFCGIFVPTYVELVFRLNCLFLA